MSGVDDPPTNPTTLGDVWTGTNLLTALGCIAEEDAGQRYCRNCGDPFDLEATIRVDRRLIDAWRPCPRPSPGRPLVDCGVGGHMYIDETPRVD